MNIQLQFIVIKEGDTFIAHFPALDMSTCGDTYEEAIKRAGEIPGIFFEETMKRGILESSLKELGWKKHARDKQQKNKWTPPHVVGSENQIFKIPAVA